MAVTYDRKKCKPTKWWIPQDQGRRCRDVQQGHGCKYGTHDDAKHTCRCGYRWMA